MPKQHNSWGELLDECQQRVLAEGLDNVNDKTATLAGISHLNHLTTDLHRSTRRIEQQISRLAYVGYFVGAAFLANLLLGIIQML